MKRLLAGDEKTAAERFDKCLGTQENTFDEHILARAGFTRAKFRRYADNTAHLVAEIQLRFPYNKAMNILNANEAKCSAQI